jgi:NADH-quinone oxidoreductase subunit J
MIIPFCICAAVALVSTLLVIMEKNAVHALLYFIVSLLSVSVIFCILGAGLAAVFTVILNAGAIMVLFLFVVMMLNLGPKSSELEKQSLCFRFWAGPAALAMILFAELVYTLVRYQSPSSQLHVLSAGQVGRSLFGPYLLAVELASFLLLSGLIGAFHLGRDNPKENQSRK